MKNIQMVEILGEPKLEEYFERVTERQNRRADADIDINNRADIGFKDESETGRSKSLLVDVATKSIMVKGVKTYKAGDIANMRTSEKIRCYEKRFKIDDENKANLYFFTVESLGAFGEEARKLCKYLANYTLNDLYCIEIQRIYQRLSVSITANIERQTQAFMFMIRNRIEV